MFIFLKCRIVSLFCVKNNSQKIDSPALLWHVYLTLHWVCHLHLCIFRGCCWCTKRQRCESKSFTLRIHTMGGIVITNWTNFYGFLSWTKFMYTFKKVWDTMRYQIFVEVLVLDCCCGRPILTQGCAWDINHNFHFNKHAQLEQPNRICDMQRVNLDFKVFYVEQKIWKNAHLQRLCFF